MRALLLSAAVLCLAGCPKKGTWQLVSTKRVPVGAVHLILIDGKPLPVGVPSNPGNKPGISTLDIRIPSNQILDHLSDDLLSPQSIPPQNNGCTFVISNHLHEVSDSEVIWTAINNGDKCNFLVGIYVRDAGAVIDTGIVHPWVGGDYVDVAIPTTTLTATIVGSAGGRAIRFPVADTVPTEYAKMVEHISTTLLPSAAHPTLREYLYKIR